jgi:DNA invertase Pin-like site-specific DNA recombinase
MCGVFAEFERAMIVERVNAGLKRAGAYIKAALAKGNKGILKIATEFGVGSGTVQRIRAEMGNAG